MAYYKFYLLSTLQYSSLYSLYLYRVRKKRPPVFKYGAVVVVVLIQRWRWYCSISVYVPFLVDAMAWIGEHRAFVVVEFIRNGESVITAQRAFCIRFQLHRRDPVLDRKTIQV